jgi:hypothetical protein
MSTTTMNTPNEGWQLQPEIKFNRAQDAQRGVIARTRAILERDVSEEMGADDLEVLALQFKLAGANLMTSARELREVEEERRRLVTVMERERVRFEAEPPEHAEA